MTQHILLGITLFSEYMSKFSYQPNLQRRFSGIPESYRNDEHHHFPALTKFIEHIAEKGHHQLEGGADKSTKAIVEAIKAKDGRYIIINHRTTEWIAIEMIKALLAKREGNPVLYRVWMSHINDDIGKHTDMILEARTGSQKIYFAVDITYGEGGFDTKIVEHAQWQYSPDKTIRIGGGVPTDTSHGACYRMICCI